MFAVTGMLVKVKLLTEKNDQDVIKLFIITVRVFFIAESDINIVTIIVIMYPA